MTRLSHHHHHHYYKICINKRVVRRIRKCDEDMRFILKENFTQNIFQERKTVMRSMRQRVLKGSRMFFKIHLSNENKWF